VGGVLTVDRTPIEIEAALEAEYGFAIVLPRLIREAVKLDLTPVQAGRRVEFALMAEYQAMRQEDDEQ
jgi:hypothetical protein